MHDTTTWSDILGPIVWLAVLLLMWRRINRPSRRGRPAAARPRIPRPPTNSRPRPTVTRPTANNALDAEIVAWLGAAALFHWNGL